MKPRTDDEDRYRLSSRDVSISCIDISEANSIDVAFSDTYRIDILAISSPVKVQVEMAASDCPPTLKCFNTTFL